ncbi:MULTISPECIES: MFS transporter [Tsukamurella]|uniref:MFS transporter n=2 Tax=Tsukamurella TaxID=2060 RepID=A0A5C5RZ85_9ACTN|nr:MULTISPECIES: MFS transporter [Tsukamurella]NMD54514.1 MFS transporter [Tsukamurella columbiensis]TWS28437.1 MFS transporter [Tsukamurella conjunctivitidis]
MPDSLAQTQPDTGRGREILARMDRLPVVRSHIVWIVLIAVNMMIEYYDNGLNIPLATELPRDPQTGVAPEAVGNVLSIFYAGMIVGAIIGGRLADRFGRRPVLIWGTVLYSCASLMTAALPYYESLLVSRFITGIGVQAVTSVLVTYMAELFPAARRGRFVAVSTISFTATAPFLAGLAAFILPNNPPGAWRILALVGAAGLFVVPAVRLLMPESPRWLIANGRIDEAERVVDRLEAEALASGKTLAPVVVTDEAREAKMTFRGLMSDRGLLKIIAVVGFGWFGATLGLYMHQNFVVDILYAMHLAEGRDEAAALNSSYISYLVWSCLYVVTPILTFLLIGRFERKTVILLGSLAGAAAILGMAFGGISVYNVGATLAFILTGVVFSTYYAYIPEVVPTQARGFGSGIIFGIGRLGAMVTGILYTALYYPSPKGVFGWDREGVYIVAAGAYVVSALVVVAFGPKTANRSLEEVAHDQVLSAGAPSQTTPTDPSSSKTVLDRA